MLGLCFNGRKLNWADLTRIRSFIFEKQKSENQKLKSVVTGKVVCYNKEQTSKSYGISDNCSVTKQTRHKNQDGFQHWVFLWPNSSTTGFLEKSINRLTLLKIMFHITMASWDTVWEKWKPGIINTSVAVPNKNKQLMEKTWRAQLTRLATERAHRLKEFKRMCFIKGKNKQKKTHSQP